MFFEVVKCFHVNYEFYVSANTQKRKLCHVCPQVARFEHYNMLYNYRKFPKYSDTQTICSNHSKILTMWLYHRVMSPNDADGMANSIDPDQTAPRLLLLEQSDLGLHCLPRPVCPKT